MCRAEHTMTSFNCESNLKVIIKEERQKHLGGFSLLEEENTANSLGREYLTEDKRKIAG